MRSALGRLSTGSPRECGQGPAAPGRAPAGAALLRQRRIFRDEQLATVLRNFDPRRSHTEITAQWYRRSAGWDPVARMQHVDLFTWLRGDILVKADKMTMATHSSCGCRSWTRRSSGWRPASRCRRRSSAVPTARDDQSTRCAGRWRDRAGARAAPPQAGFPVPIRHWLRDEMYDWAAGIIRDSQTDHLLDLAAVRGCWTSTAPARSTTADGSGPCWVHALARHLRGGRITPEIPSRSTPFSSDADSPHRFMM